MMSPADIEPHARDVHRELQRRFVWAPDQETFGKPDHWAVLPWRQPGLLRGDCDDFALTACDMLLALEVPAARLRLVYCLTEMEDGHLVAMVDAGDGYAREMVIDNRQRVVWQRASIPYQWKSFRQLDWPALAWRAVAT